MNLSEQAQAQADFAGQLADELCACGWGIDALGVLDALASTGLVLAEAPLGDVFDSPAVQAYYGESEVEAEKWVPAERVYFVRSGELTKIGFTKNLERRVRALHFNGPGATLLFSYRGPRALEKALHDEFAAHRKHGEWFELPDDWRLFADEVARKFGNYP